MTMARSVFCEVDQIETEGLDFAPWPGEAGKRVFAHVGKPAWQRWLAHQTMLINENRLSPLNPQHRAMLEGGVWRDGECIFEGLSMNDVVVSRGATASMVEIKIDVGDQFVANMRADGVIVASPTGSTAYALSAGGPMLHPAIAGWVMAPIAPHTLSNRPIVLPSDGEISVELVAGKDASANFDMQTFTELMHGDRIIVKRSPHQLRLLHPTGWSYFDTLRKKLHWNEGVA